MSDSETPWTIACQPPLSTGFPRQEHWSGSPFPTTSDLSDLGIEPCLAGEVFTKAPPGTPCEEFKWVLIQINKKAKFYPILTSLKSHLSFLNFLFLITHFVFHVNLKPLLVIVSNIYFHICFPKALSKTSSMRCS